MLSSSRAGLLSTLFFLTCLSALAQPSRDQDDRRVAEKLPSLMPLVEELQRALEARDFQAALSARKKLDAGMRELKAEPIPTPESLLESIKEARKERLASMEQRLARGGPIRDFALGLAAIAAEAAGEYDKARLYARETLASVKQSRFPAQNTYYGNHALGLLALRDGDIAGARTYLLASADNAGWPSMAKYGPDLTLAKRLLQKGEREAVIGFLERCQTLWPSGKSKLEQWQAIIKAGSEPEWDETFFIVPPP